MGKLTTHVLDTARGRPASGLKVALYRVVEGDTEHVTTVTTNADGRTDAPLLEGEALRAGVYQLVFSVGAYFGEPAPFLDDVLVRFTVADAAQSYHVPLLVAPYGYTTYRGS